MAAKSGTTQAENGVERQGQTLWHATDIDEIFASLRARFGISAIDARAHLQRLRRDPHTTLQEHAITVMKLAQIAFCLKYTVRGIPLMPSCNP